MNYKKMYFMLFAAMADAVEAIEHGRIQEAERILIIAQRKAEENYISGE